MRFSFDNVYVFRSKPLTQFSFDDVSSNFSIVVKFEKKKKRNTFELFSSQSRHRRVKKRSFDRKSKDAINLQNYCKNIIVNI